MSFEFASWRCRGGGLSDAPVKVALCTYSKSSALFYALIPYSRTSASRSRRRVYSCSELLLRLRLTDP